jgi:NADH-quinone oxidoreductase subunit G
MKLERVSGEDLGAVREAAKRLAEAGEEVVILWGERFAAGPDGAERVRALLDLAAELSLGETDGAGLLEIPATSNGRGLREAGVLPNGGPGLSEREQDGLDTRAIAEALGSGELSALYLFEVDPLGAGDPFAVAGLDAAAAADGDGGGSSAWERGLERASTVVAHATLLSAGLAEHANVIFPAGSYAEKEGTVTHPDGRLQRVRQAVAEAGDTRPGWRVIAELSLRLGTDLDVYDAKEASQQLFDAVPFYGGVTLEEIGGRGVRWQERETAAVGASASPQQMAPSAEAHSGPDRDTHAADMETEGESSSTGEPSATDGDSQ